MFVTFNMSRLKSNKVNVKMIQEYSALEVTPNKENKLHLFFFWVEVITRAREQRNQLAQLTQLIMAPVQSVNCFLGTSCRCGLR